MANIFEQNKKPPVGAGGKQTNASDACSICYFIIANNKSNMQVVCCK